MGSLQSLGFWVGLGGCVVRGLGLERPDRNAACDECSCGDLHVRIKCK